MRGSQILVEMLLFFLSFFLPGYIAQSGFGAGGVATTPAMLQAIVASVPQFLLMVYVVSPGALGASPESQDSRARWGLVPMEARDALRILLLVIGCFVVFVPFAGLTLLLPSSWGRFLSRGFRWSLQAPAQIPLALAFGIATGYREEFYFRSYLLQRLPQLGVSTTAAVAISTALFSFGHLYEGLLGFAIAAVLGVLFSAVYLQRRSLHLIALGHGLYNGIVLCVSLLGSSALPGGSG